MKIYIGFDQRLSRAWDVAARSARRYDCDVIKLDESKLRLAGMLTRPVDYRERMYDINSNAYQSTEFAISRFAVHLLAHEGWCLFADSDTLCLDDPRKLLKYCDPAKAVCVVKHTQESMVARAGAGFKMDGQIQSWYPRKLWSSVMLINCDHPANRRLNLMVLNQWPGRDLHAFKWLADDEIGDLPMEANWLVGLQEIPTHPLIAHYTLGTPDIPGYENCPHADLWWDEERTAA